MNTIITKIIAALPLAVIKILAAFFPEKTAGEVLTLIIIRALRAIAPLTTNTIDDKIIEVIIKRLETPS